MLSLYFTCLYLICSLGGCTCIKMSGELCATCCNWETTDVWIFVFKVIFFSVGSLRLICRSSYESSNPNARLWNLLRLCSSSQSGGTKKKSKEMILIEKYRYSVVLGQVSLKASWFLRTPLYTVFWQLHWSDKLALGSLHVLTCWAGGASV